LQSLFNKHYIEYFVKENRFARIGGILNFDRVETVAIKNGIIAILNSKLAPS